MLFSSFEFIFIFLPITFFIYFYLNRRKLLKISKLFLLFASLFFYSWWNIWYLPIIVISMVFNYIIGIYLNRVSFKKSLLYIGIISNLLLLGYFKYTDFLIENVNLFFDKDIPLLHLALPLGISFFTFQQIAYLVDSYYNKTSDYNFINYAVFVTFFPQLIAGPIVHHEEMMPQFDNIKNKFINYKNIALGLFIFAIGLFKKVVIADSLSVWVGNGFDKADTLTFVDAWITSLSYTFQLYYDFSGYTDMAIGAALLFNIKLPINFNSPYKSGNIQEFWRRWHITLSRFLRDYIYIPLGGNRKGTVRTSLNLFITFLLGGIWHGAGWNFIIWGSLHGIAIVIHRLWSKLSIYIPYLLGWFLTFNFVNISWVFFRAKDFDSAIKVLSGMFGLNGLLPEGVTFSGLLSSPSSILFDFKFSMEETSFMFLLTTVIFMGVLFGTFYMRNSIEYLKEFKPNRFYLVWFVSIVTISLLFMNSTQQTEFLYFDF